MKTISLIAVSTLLGCAVSGQMMAPTLADEGSDFQPPSNDQEIPAPLEPVSQMEEPHPIDPPSVHEESSEFKHHHDPSPPPPPPPPPQVVHITKTKTQIVYPRPNEWQWKNLPTLPFHKHKGKVVAKFYVDGNGHYREIKHGRHYASRFSHSWNEDEYPKFDKDGMHPHGKVVYGGPWTGPSPHKHKGGSDSGHHGYRHHQHGKDIYEGHRKESDPSHHGHEDGDKKKEYYEKDDYKNHNLNETDSQGGKNKNDWKKKTAEGYQAKGIEGIVAQNNTAAPIAMGASSGSASVVSASVSASASRGGASAAAGGAQKTPAAGSASSMAANASAKNAAATSSVHPSSAKPSGSSMTTSASNAGANTRPVALSFVAVIAATAVWCLA